MPALSEYEKIVRQFAFKDLEIWGENADRYFKDIDAMTGWIDQPSIVPFLDRIDSVDQKPFRDAVVRRMIEATLQDDGTCFETFRRINVLARK